MKPSPEDIVQAIYDATEKGLRVVIVAGGGGGGGGTVELGPASLAALSPGVPEHHNGTVGTSATPVGFSGTSKSVLVRNTHAANDLSVSLDAGTSFFTIPPGAAVSLDCAVAGMVVQGSAPGTTYETLVTV